jgi:transposase
MNEKTYRLAKGKPWQRGVYSLCLLAFFALATARWIDTGRLSAATLFPLLVLVVLGLIAFRGLLLKKGRAQTMTHDYKRHGTTTLFAALNVLDGQVIGQCQQRHTHLEWLKFLKKIDRETPKDKTLHLIADNYATHKHPAVQEWLAKRPRFNMHFTPTSASWLNMVERFFRDLTTERLRRGVFTSVPELVGAINEYVQHHNTNPKPFIWTKSARDILQKVIRANSKLSSKQNETLH